MVDLIADIGGTNARFACYTAPDRNDQTGRLCHIESVLTADFPTLEAAIEHYCNRLSIKPKRSAIAVAGPVDDDAVSMANNHWSFRKTELKTQFGLESLMVINDFTAQALVPPYLGADEKQLIRKGSAVANTPIAVLGPGTGLGFSCLVPVGKDKWKPLETEGGNILFSPRNDIQSGLLEFIWQHKSELVSFEEVISGRGLEMIYRFITKGKSSMAAADISAHAKDNTAAKQAVLLFLDCLASYISTAILITGSRQGVYLSGGILQHVLAFIEESSFHHYLSTHGSYSHYINTVPVYLVTAEMPGLIGAGLALSNPYLDHRRI